jgi:hypothetical protein
VSVHGDRLVGVGGSIGGLTAARVLSDHFAEVTIVERGGLPDSSGPRRGVPQGVHLHALTLGGRLALDQIYGNDSFTIAMRYVGAAYLDFCKHQAVLLPEGWLRCAPSDVEMVCGSRSFMEHVIRTEYRSPGGEFLAKNVSQSCCKPRSGHRDSMTVEPWRESALNRLRLLGGRLKPCAGRPRPAQPGGSTGDRSRRSRPRYRGRRDQSRRIELASAPSDCRAKE